MIQVNGVWSTDFIINFHFLFLGKLIDCVVKYIYKKKKITCDIRTHENQVTTQAIWPLH